MEGRLRKDGYCSPERLRGRCDSPGKLPERRHRRQYNDNLKQQKQQQQQQQQKQLQRNQKIPVVYYLCRNMHLEHPHFIEVPLSSPEGLFLRDVIDRLNVLRGKGMAALYSWSCKRSYKNGFVWHDLSEDDLILPAAGNEFVLKGSELLNESPPEHHHQSTSRSSKLQNPNKPKHIRQEPTLQARSQDSSPSSSGTLIREENSHPLPSQSPTKPSLSPLPPTSQEDDLSPGGNEQSSCSGNASPDSKRDSSQGSDGSRSPCMADYKVFKLTRTVDASTQIDDVNAVEKRALPRVTHTRGVSTDEGNDNPSPRLKGTFEISRDGGDISPPPTSSSTSSSGGKTETLESLIRADARKMNSFRILEEEDVCVPINAKLKATNVLMQLITCGSISVKDHHSFGIVPTYKPKFARSNYPSPMFCSSMGLGELDCISDSSRFTSLRFQEKEYFSGSIIETKKLKDEGCSIPTLKRSSSYNADRNNFELPNTAVGKNEMVDSGRLKCLPRSIKITSSKQSKKEIVQFPVDIGRRRISSEGPQLCTSVGNSKRFTDTTPSANGSSKRVESFREDDREEKVIKIEESLHQVLVLQSNLLPLVMMMTANDDEEREEDEAKIQAIFHL